MGLLDSLAANFATNASNSALEEWRARALNEVRARGLPSAKEEDWKYTDLTRLAAQAFTAGPAHSTRAALPLSAVHAYRLVFVNGHFDAPNSDLASLPNGVTVRLLSELARGEPEHTASRLADRSVNAKLFTALNAATARDGAYIEIADACVLDRPLLLIFVTESADDARWSSPHVHIRGGARSQSSVIEMHTGAGTTPCFVNALTTVATGDSATLAHYRITAESTRTTHIGQLQLEVGRNSDVTSYSLALSGELIRLDIDCALGETGGNVTLNGVFIAGSGQHIDHHTKVDHRANHTTSSETYKGIASGNGRGVFNGKIVVQPGTQKIEATQASNNLLLSSEAEIDTKPELEIYADDLRCAHGATVGQLDHDALFYLQARGIPAADASALLTFGFVEELVSAIPISALPALVASRLARDNPTLARLLSGDAR